MPTTFSADVQSSAVPESPSVEVASGDLGCDASTTSAPAPAVLVFTVDGAIPFVVDAIVAGQFGAARRAVAVFTIHQPVTVVVDSVVAGLIAAGVGKARRVVIVAVSTFLGRLGPRGIARPNSHAAVPKSIPVSIRIPDLSARRGPVIDAAGAVVVDAVAQFERDAVHLRIVVVTVAALGLNHAAYGGA